MEDDEVLLLNRPESQLTNPPGHAWHDKWTALSGPLSHVTGEAGVRVPADRHALDLPVAADHEHGADHMGRHGL